MDEKKLTKQQPADLLIDTMLRMTDREIAKAVTSCMDIFVWRGLERSIDRAYKRLSSPPRRFKNT